MPVKKGESKIQYNEMERADIVERVCQLYESQNSTIQSCCNACGISDSVFRLWCVKYVEISERYKKAKLNAETVWFEEILKPKAMRATELLLIEREVEETREEDVFYQGEKATEKKNVITKTKVQPNATTAIFAMKGAFPDKFKDKVEHSGPDGGPIKFDGLTTDEKVLLLSLIEKSQGGG